MSPVLFFDLLLYTVSQTETVSLSYMASEMESKFGIDISKQALHERFNADCVSFLKAVLREVLSGQFANLYSREMLPDFTRIRIKDSTKFLVPRSLEGEYGSCGGDVHSRSKASISIQYEFDLKSGEVTDLSLTSGARNDRADAGETVGNMEKNDLIIHDSGYFLTPVFERCAEQKAYFFSRLDSSTHVYDETGTLIDFKKNYELMQEQGIREQELFVYAGKKTGLPVRLIMQAVPEEVYQKRIREKTAKSKGQGRGTLTAETKARCRFTLFITNAEETQFSGKQVFLLYRLRWQIELQFKIWKSVYKIAAFREMKKNRYLTLLYTKLLLIIINLQITCSLQQPFNCDTRDDEIRIISNNKALKTLKTLFGKVFTMLRGTYRKAMECALYIRDRLSKNHWLESKNKKLCLPEILMLIICLSKE